MGRSQVCGYVVTFLFLTSKWTWQVCTLGGFFFTFEQTLCFLLDKTRLLTSLPGTLTLPCSSTSCVLPSVSVTGDSSRGCFLSSLFLCLRQNLTMLACDAFLLHVSFTLYLAIIFMHSLFLYSTKKKKQLWSGFLSVAVTKPLWHDPKQHGGGKCLFLLPGHSPSLWEVKIRNLRWKPWRNCLTIWRLVLLQPGLRCPGNSATHRTGLFYAH